MERILVSYGHKNDWISNFNVESILNTVVSNIPGSFWWYDSYLIDSPENFKHYYWLKVPEYSLSDNNGLYCERKHYTERFLARLIVLRYNESINISGVTITPQSHNQVICIDSYAPKNGGHWKVLWSDLQRELQIYIPLEDNNSYRVTRLLSNEPIQLGPCLRLIGWVSGHTYSPETKDDTTPGSQTYNWCFLIPIDLDHLHNVTVFLLPSEIKDLSNTPPTQHLESIRLVGGIDENINHLNTSLRELFTAIKRANFTYYKQSSYTETFNNNNTNTKKDNNFFTISSLFEFGTRLTIITQPYNTTKKQSYMHSMGIDSVCSLDSLNYRCRTADSRKFSQYTYIKTQNGRPVYKNGAFIEQAKKTAKEEQSEYTNGEKHSHNQPFIIDHINNMDLNQRHFVSCMQHHVTISCDTNALSLEKDVNGIETKCFTDVYPLEELEVVSSKQTIPPPWLSGFNKSESTSSHVNSQKGSDQSAVFTSSELSASMIEPDQVNTRSSVDGQQNIPDSLTVYSVFSNPTEEYESRTNLLINLLGELNLLSQIVLCTENENESHTYDVPEICKSILQGLTELLNEEEDEEDICDQEYSLPSQSAEQKDQINVASSMNNTVVTTGKRNDVSEICVPLPTVCRVKSPIRLLVFYFEILSELMELKDHENKCSEDNQEDISTLMDMSAGVLRLLDIDDNDDKNNYDNNSDNNNEGGEADATNLSCYRTCENAMHTLIRLQDAWIAAPVIIEMLDTTGVSKSFHGSMNPTVEIYETAKLYLTRIQSALNKQRCDMRNLISNDLNSLQEKSTDLFVEESSVENFENLCKLVVDTSLTEEFELHKQLFQSAVYDPNDLCKTIRQQWDHLPLPIAHLWKKRRKVCIVSDSIGKEDHEKSDLAWKSSSNSIDDHIWEEFYEFNKAYMECLITYLNEVKCIVTIHTEANASSLSASSSSSAAAAVTNDNTCAKTSQSFDYPTVHLLESSEINLLDNNWQQNQLIHIDKEREILQANFNEISVLAVFLHVLFSSSSSSSSSTSSSFPASSLPPSSSSQIPLIKDIKQQKLWQELINQMRLTASRAFEQYTCLGFLKQIIRRPGGLYDLSNFLTELLNRFLNTSQSHIWSELELYYYELTIRHLCHQIWIELATINELNSEHFDKTEYIGVKNWLEAWIYRVQEVYRLIVNLWQDKMNQFQDNLHILIINQWCDYVTDCIDESELSEMRRNDFPPVNAFLPSHQTSQESQSQQQQKLDNKPSKKEIHFSLLWSLLCDAEMIQEKCSVQLEKLPSKGVYFSKTLQKLKKHLDVYIKNLTTSSSPSSSPSLSNVIPQSKSFDTSHNSLSYLIQQLEYSLHSLPVHYRVFWLEVTNDTGSVTHQSDQLRVILQELRQLRNLCERNCMLCKQSLSLLHKLSLSSLEQHELFAVKNMLQLLNTWNYGYSILRQSLERVIRAGEVVESERYPLRTLNTSELRSESIQMLKQKQAFIEAVQFGLETIRLQMKSTSVKLHEYDTTSKLIDHKTKFQHLLESLKSLYHSILNDDRLKTTNRSEIPDDDLNCLVIARTKQAIELSQLCRKMDQVNWNTAWDGFLEFTNEAKVDSGNSSRWIVYFLQHCHAFSSKINMEEVYQCQINQLEEIMHDWTGWIKKYIWPLPFPYPKNYSWTPIIISSNPSMNIICQHNEYEKSLKMDCQHLTSKINHKFMKLSNFYQNHIKNKSSLMSGGGGGAASTQEAGDNTGEKAGVGVREDKTFEHSMELLDVNYPNSFLEEIRNICQFTSPPLPPASAVKVGAAKEQVICQCSFFRQLINNRLHEIQSRLIYGDHLTLVMIEQILFDLFEIKFPDHKILTTDSQLDKLWMDIYSECIKYLRNGFLKCLCTILTNDPSTQTPNNIPASQYPNEFDIPGSKGFNERWHNKLKIDRLVRNSSESEKQFLFLIHLIVLFNLYDTWQNIVQLARLTVNPKETSVYNPLLLQWVLTTRPKLIDVILAYPTIKASHNYQCSQCVCNSVLGILLSVNEVELNNLFRKFTSHSDCIDYLIMESVQNLSEKINYCIQKIDNHHTHLRILPRFMPTNEQGEEVKSQIWKEIDCIRSGDLKTMNLRHSLSRWHEVLVKKLECGRNFNRIITNCSKKIHSLTLNLQPAESMETVDCVAIEKRLLHLQVIMNQTDKMLHDLQTIDFRTSISHSIKFINLVNQLLVLRQQNIVQRVLYNRLKYYLSELQNPSTFHRRLLHVFKLGTEGCRQITSELMRILNLTGSVDDATYCDDKIHESSMDYQYLEKPLFKMQIKSPGQSGLEQLFCKLSLVDKYCSEAQSYLSQKFSWFPLKSGLSLNNQYEPMIGSDGSESYLNELINQLVISLLCPSVVKTKIETLSGESEKLRNVLSAFADSTNEMNAFRDQLCIAIPQLTGYHLTNLSKAVDELELWANSKLNESHCPMDPVEKRHPQLGAQLKHAGQRLMELETCLEHSREAANILKFFEHETQIWSSALSPSSSSLPGKRESSQEVARKRGLLLQSNFESSPVACRLHTAWMKLTQLGDRLGRIQAGLPVRPSGENGTQVWVNNEFSPATRYTQVVSSAVENHELQVSPAILPPHPSPPSHRHISPVQTQSNLPTNLRSRLIKNEVNRNTRWNKDNHEFPHNVISAEKLRRRQTNLRDALGSHQCVYPDCKESREECLRTHVGGCKKEMNIEDKIEYIFRKIINLHACLQKDYNESYHYEVYQRRNSSISKSELNRLVRYSCRRRWHNSFSLKSDYEELKILIDELMNSEYPKINKLQECFKSLEDLWFGKMNSRENLNRRVNRSRSRSRVSNDEHDYNSIESIYEDVRGNTNEFRHYIQQNGTYSHSTISPLNPTAPPIPHTYDSVSNDYETPHTQKPCQSYKDKADNLSNEEFCDWTWREIRNHGSDAQPLVFPSSEAVNRTHLTVSVARSQDPCDTKVVPLNSQMYQFSKTPDFHSGTTPSEKVSINTSEDSSENAPSNIKNGIPVHAKNTTEVHIQQIKLLPLNTVDQTRRSTSPASIQRDWLSQPNRTISETPCLNKDETHCVKANQSDEIYSYYMQPGEIADSSVVTTTSRRAYLDSITPSSKINAMPQYIGSNEFDPSYKNKHNPPSTSPIPDGHITPKSTNVKLCVNKPTTPDVNSHVSINNYISSSLVDSTVSREVILEVPDVSSSKNLDLDHIYRSTHTNFITSDKQPLNVSTDSSKTENSVNGISTASQHKVTISDIPAADSYSSRLTMTTTTVNINLLQHKSLEDKLKSSEVTNGTVPSESCITTSKAESVPSPSSFSLSTYSSLYNSTRRAFHQIYQCRHLDTTTCPTANDNVDNDATDRSMNSMCDLCQHMTNLHTLISILQSHLLSNRQNRLCNLLPVDIESFTQTSSSISSLSTYWSPIIKEYLTIIHEIKSELNSFQSSSSYLECKIVHLPEYKSMDDLLNIWQCRLQDFLCLRSSINSASGVNIPQTRWLTLFISLIQHNEIQVEYLKSVFTSLIHYIQNDYDESNESEPEANNTNNDHNRLLTNSYTSEVVQSHDHSQNIRNHLPTERLRISLKHEYLDDLKSRLFAHDLVDQQTITSPIQLFPSFNSSLLTLPTVNFTPSSRSKREEEGNTYKIPSTVMITGVYEKNDKDGESQTSPKLHGSGTVSFEQQQQTPNFHQIVTHNKSSSSTEPFTGEIPCGKSIQKTETLEESKDNCNETNWITVRRGKQKKAKKRKYKNEDYSKGKNSNRTGNPDNADHKDPHQLYHSVKAPELMQTSHVDEKQITSGDNQVDSSLYLRTSTPVSEKLSSTNQIYSQEFYEAKIHTAKNGGSDELNDMLSFQPKGCPPDVRNRGVNISGESKRTDSLIGKNNLREDSKPGPNDTEADGRVKEEENANYTNKSDDLASWISMQSDSSPSVTDLNMVFGVNTVEDKQCRVGDFPKFSSEDSNLASIKYATERIEVCNIFKSDATDNYKTTLTPVITNPPVEFDTPLKSGYHLERNKKHVQHYEHGTTDTHFKASELKVSRDAGGVKGINSSGTEPKNKSQSRKYTKVGFIQNDDHEVLNKEILSENEKQIPSTEANRSSVSKDNDEGDISALVNISNASKTNIYSHMLEDNTDGGQSLKSKTLGLANDDSLDKNVIKVSHSNMTANASSPSSPVSTSNEPIHDSNKVPPSKRRTRKTNRKAAVSRHLNKRLMANNLEPTAMVDQSSKYHAAARGVSTEHTSMSLKSKQHSESDSDATPNSSLTRTIPTSEVPTTISLRPAWSESYHSSFTSDKDKTDNMFHEEINSATFQQHEDNRTKQACLPPTGSSKCTISFEETNESSSNSLSLTDRVVVGPSRLPEGNLSNYEFETFSKSIETSKYPLSSSKDENIDLEQNVYKQRKQLEESQRKRITKLSRFYQHESLKKGKNSDSVSRSSQRCHDNNDDNDDDDDDNSNNNRHDQHEFHSERRNPQLTYEVENVYVLRQIPFKKQGEFQNELSAESRNAENTIQHSDGIHSSSSLFKNEKRKNDSFLTDDDYSQLKRRQQVISTSETEEDNLQRREELINAKKSTLKRRCCRLLPWLLLLLPLLFLFFVLLCTFVIPGCPLLLPWFICDERSPTGEWIFRSFVVFRIREPPF